jgi:hypothetical protein
VRVACLIVMSTVAAGCGGMYTTRLRAPVDSRLSGALIDIDMTASDVKFDGQTVPAESAAAGWLRQYWQNGGDRGRVTLSAVRQGDELEVQIQDFNSASESPLAAEVRKALHERLIRRFGENAVRCIHTVEHLWLY